MSTVSWEFLLIGTFAALAAALALGTLAALSSYYRHGTFPNQDPSDPVTRGRLVGLWMRVAVGMVLAVAGVVTLAQRGLLDF